MNEMFYTCSYISILFRLFSWKIIVCICIFTADKQDPFFMTLILKPLVLGQSLKNMGEMEDYLATECPDIEYTSVRAPQLSNSETTGIDFI